MPLLDHFRPPLSLRRHWDGFHGAWATSMAQHLNEKILPPGLFAEPHIRWGGAVEIDVATLGEKVQGGDPRTGTLLWCPPRPTVRIPLSAGRQDVAEVRVFSEEGGPRLIAAVELLSPANKDRPATRRAFAVKCAAYLQSDVSTIVIDVVTTRKSSIHAELLALVGTDRQEEEAGGLHAAAYRMVVETQEPLLEIWLEPLELGRPLPELPLWIDAETALPLDLEDSYQATCRLLRI